MTYLKPLFLVACLVVTSCDSKEASSSLEQSSSETKANLAAFQIVRNDTTTAEAAASLGCIGYPGTSPGNLELNDAEPKFEELFKFGRISTPWLFKIEQIGVSSGKLTPSNGQAWSNEIINEFVPYYDETMKEFTIATMLDPKWSFLSSIWQESLNYGLEQLESLGSSSDAAIATAAAYEPILKNACKIALDAAIKRSAELKLPLSTYLYIQTTSFLQDWMRGFTVDGLAEFESRFRIVDE